MRRLYLLRAWESVRKLDKSIIVDDFSKELIEEARKADTDHSRMSYGFALAAIANAGDGSEAAREICIELAQKLIASKHFADRGYAVMQALLGDDSAPFWTEALSHSDTYVRVTAAQRLSLIGRAESVKGLLDAFAKEKNRTVARYIRDAVARIDYIKSTDLELPPETPRKANKAE